MKKNQFISASGKQLNRKEMQAVKGGAFGGPWVCVADYYACYDTRFDCLGNCSVPKSCKQFSACP